MREVLDFNELKVSGKLPSPKGVALKVMQLCQDESLSLRELAQTIQGDPALSGRIIRIANYANPNHNRPIAAVTTDTLILIGVHAIRQVVLGLSLVNEYRKGQCSLFDYERFWSHAVAMGSAAQIIASTTQAAPTAEMFNCGLMAGIGQLALVTARPEAYCDLLSSLQNDPTETLYDAQRHHFGLTQRDMTTYLLQDWGIPKLFVDAIHHHEDPAASGYAENSRPQRIACTLQLAALMAPVCMEASTDASTLGKIHQVGALLQLAPDQIEAMIEQAKVEWKAWCRMLDIRATHIEEKAAVLRQEPPAVATPPMSMPTPREEPSPSPQDMPLRIMIASNNELQSNMLKKVIAAGGHEVVVIDKGTNVVEQVPLWRPHVLITDWLLPGIDGLSLCRTLRNDPAGERLYCMIVTPFEDERQKIDAYEAGADELLRTPLNPRLVMARLLIAQRYAKLYGLS